MNALNQINMDSATVGIFAVGIIAGIVAIIVIWKIISRTKTKTLKQQLDRQISDAKREAENITKTAQLEVAAESLKKREKVAKEIEQSKS